LRARLLRIGHQTRGRHADARSRRPAGPLPPAPGPRTASAHARTPRRKLVPCWGAVTPNSSASVAAMSENVSRVPRSAPARTPREELVHLAHRDDHVPALREPVENRGGGRLEREVAPSLGAAVPARRP